MRTTAYDADMADTPGNMIDIAPNIVIHRDALRFAAVRSSGPGGQNVNKVASQVQMHVALDDLEAVIGAPARRRLERLVGSAHLTNDGDLFFRCGESRSQHANRNTCIERLRALVVRALHPPKPRRKTKPSRASRERRLKRKHIRGETKARRRRPSRDD